MGGRKSSCPLQAQDSVYLAAGPVYRDCAVDRKAEPTAHPRPAFTPNPAQSCYSAEVEFVVDATGVPEPGTAHVVRSNSRDFAEALTAVVPQLRFQPAMRDGIAVRQIVEFMQMAATGSAVTPLGSSLPPPVVPLPPHC